MPKHNSKSRSKFKPKPKWMSKPKLMSKLSSKQRSGLIHLIRKSLKGWEHATESQSDRVTDTQGYSVYEWVKLFLCLILINSHTRFARRG